MQLLSQSCHEQCRVTQRRCHLRGLPYCPCCPDLMNQWRSSITVRDSSVDAYQRSTLQKQSKRNDFFHGYSESERGRQFTSQFNFQERYQPSFYDISPINNHPKPVRHNISRSIPIERPRAEIAHPYHNSDCSLFGKNDLIDYQSEIYSPNQSERFYSVEEHHDDFNFRVLTDSQYSKNLTITIPDTPQGDIGNSKVAEAVHLLLASHSHPSVSTHSSISDRTENHSLESTLNLLRFPHRTEHLSSIAQPAERPLYKKPQVYRTEDRKVERITYHPKGSQHLNSTYPIIELSVAKGAAVNGNPLIGIPYNEEDTNWPANPNFQSRSFLRNGSESNNQQVKFQTNTYQNPGSVTAQKYNHLYSGKQTANSDIEGRAASVDYSSLDAFLDGSVLEEPEDMSRSTKEWQSSFSTMRNRFGRIPGAQDESFSSNHDFTTNGSVTLPRRALAKSASQGSLTVGRNLDSNHRQGSLLASAVERRRAAEAPELRRPASRRELGDFWTETIKNHSIAQRTSSPLTAAQRLEMLHESANDSSRAGRRFSGESLAARKANFLKEAVKSASSLMDRVITGRSTPIPLAVNGKHTVDIKIKENSVQPNFAALDSAVAELNDYEYAHNRSSGCAKFPTDDLSSLSPTGKKIELTAPINGAALTRSPSPEATSDASSSYSAPSGLPHPKPKHNIREQLIQAGFEPRGTAIYVNRSGVRFGSAPNFPIPSNGSVASRISEFEKRPGAPNLLQIACALNGCERQRNEASPVRSPSGPMSPRSSIYRTKPVIHADISGASARASPLLAVNDRPVFEFPPSKQLSDIEV